MAANPERRTVLLDSAIDVLARDGARGLTFRAVDAEAAVPAGTASNYFTDRDTLLDQVAQRIHVRLEPDPSEYDHARKAPPSESLVPELMTALVRRVSAERSGYLALLELRLEATRRPAVREALTRTIRDNLRRDIDFHRSAGLPGDDTTVVYLYLALSWLIVENLTLPGVLADFSHDDLITGITQLVVPSTQAGDDPAST